MDDATPTDDWAAVLQERFLSDLARVEASEQLTPGERIWPVFLSCSRPITRH